MELSTSVQSTWKALSRVPRRTGRLLRLGLRKLKLQIIPQLTKWKADTEEPKVVLYRHRGIALLHVLPHTIPFGAVMTLMVFNINTFFIGNLSTSAVAAFQFAAKLLELLMQASLATILLDVIRRQIVKNQDLPFGGLLAPLRTTDLSYLWSLELWSSLSSKHWRMYRKFYIGALIFATIILAALVGPSGAVAIVPRQITYPTAQYLNMLNPPDNLFPHTIEYFDNGSAFSQGVAQINLIYGDGPFPIADGDGTRLFGEPVDTGLPFAAATMSSRHVSDILRTQGANTNPQGYSSSTILTMKTSQALVQAVCSENDLYDFDHNGTYLSFPEPGTLLNHFVTWGETLGHATADNNILFFTNLPPSAPSRNSTLLVIGTTAPTDRSYVATASACIIDATWADVTLNATELNSWNQINYVLETRYNGEIPPSQKIDMPPAWTSRVRSAILSSQDALNIVNSYPERLFAFILSNSDIEFVEDGGVVLSPDRGCCTSDQESNAMNQYLDKTHAWSHYSAISLFTNTAWIDPATLTHQVISQLQQGYGYDASDIAVQLSLAVLGLYLLFVFTHTLLLLLTGSTGTSWDSIGDLLMLGISSRKPPTQLLGCMSVGVETFSTFRQPVSVRVNDEGHVELVFGNDPGIGKMGQANGMGMVEVNTAY